MIPDPIDDFIDAVDWDALSVWLQPLATVITGLFALIAAIVAYRAVTRQIQANAKNVQAHEGDPFGGPVAMRLGVGGSWSTVGRTRLG